MNRSKINLALQTKISSFRYTFLNCKSLKINILQLVQGASYIYKYILAPCTKILTCKINV